MYKIPILILDPKDPHRLQMLARQLLYIVSILEKKKFHKKETEIKPV